jgi:hypothetical protein
MRPFLLGVVALVAVGSLVSAGELTVTIPFDPARVQCDQAGIYTRVWIEGERVISTEGQPCLPVLKETVALPTNAAATSMEVVDAQYMQVRGVFDVMPAGPTVPLSIEQVIHPVSPDPHIYGRNVTFPFETARLAGSGPIMGIPVADIEVYPVRWNSADGHLEVLTSLTVNVDYTVDPANQTVLNRTAESEQRSMDNVRSIAVNPADVSPSGANLVEPSALAYGQYVIITHPDYQTQMQELADWKTSKGIPTNVYTTTWIQGQYTAWDLQQEIRGFLVDCRNEGADYILIVGDHDKVPARLAQLSAGSESDNAPVDLYFADVNDTAAAADRWDSNGNHIWGEPSDTVDWHPDFYTGRASVNSTAEAALYVDKVLWYEHVQALPSTDYFETAPEELRIGYSCGVLWTSPYCHGSADAEIISGYVPDSPVWEEEKLYEPNNSTAMTIAMINAGPHQVFHASHGSETGMYTSYGDMFTNTQIMALTNITTGNNVAIWNSIACLIGAIDTGLCCGDAWNNSALGGGFGAFNSRYGWGTPSSPGNGPSDVLCERFYYEYWLNNKWYLGEAHALASNHFSPPSDAYMNWCVKEYNLLGDPELPMWTAQDMTMTVTHPASISGATNILVTVNGQGGSPLSGARVCIQKGNWQTGEVYAVGTTNTSGQVTLYANPATTGTITIKAWAHNYNTYSGTITVNGTGVEDGGTPMPSSLGTIFPSPASSSVTIPLTIGQPGRVRIDVYDLSGRMVSTVADGDMAVGQQSLVWSLTGDDGRPLPSGIYTVRASAADFSGSQQLVVLR